MKRLNIDTQTTKARRKPKGSCLSITCNQKIDTQFAVRGQGSVVAQKNEGQSDEEWNAEDNDNSLDA